MSTLKSSAENLTLNADGSGNDIIFQSNGSNVATLDQAGLFTATSFAGSGASLTGLVSGTHDFTADGAIANGKPVVIQADGTVAVVTGASISEDLTVAAAVEFNSATTQFIEVDYDPNTAGNL